LVQDKPLQTGKIPHFDVLDEEQIARLKGQIDRTPHQAGVAFRDDPQALGLWKREAAAIGGEIVRAPPDWSRGPCAKAPGEFIQLARNRERSVTIGGTNQVFAPNFGARCVCAPGRFIHGHGPCRVGPCRAGYRIAGRNPGQIP